MADGMFNSGGSGGNSSSTYIYSDGSSRLPPGMTFTILGILVAILLVCYIVEQSNLQEERELDKTVYVETSKANFDTWLARRKDGINFETVWFEPGSSHRENYHCKGGQYQTTEGATVTFCCSVEAHDQVPCMVITP
jgi:hypothetical protein